MGVNVTLPMGAMRFSKGGYSLYNEIKCDLLVWGPMRIAYIRLPVVLYFLWYIDKPALSCMVFFKKRIAYIYR